MSAIKVRIKRMLPEKMLAIGRSVWGRFSRLVVYRQYDSSAYWRSRAEGTGQSRVLWTNEEYNQLYRKIQRGLLEEFVTNFPRDSHILDIGCGIGIVAKMLTEISPEIRVDAVDFPEMIQVARRENPGQQINYIGSSAEEYFESDKRYQLIISSACFSAIRDVCTMEAAIMNCINMLDRDGIILMIDPFHHWNYLARVKYSSRQVIDFMRKNRLQSIRKSGVLFWPYREWLASSDYRGVELERRFRQGEKLLTWLGQHAWADYKVLAFKKEK